MTGFASDAQKLHLRKIFQKHNYINLYKLFVEQCFNLLREGGRCGIITPGGVYTDLGSKQLREMLFTQGEVGSLFGLSNEKFIFEGVHHAQKFCLLVFKKGGRTDNFEAAFRINPRDAVAQDRLDQFLNSPTEHLWIPAALVRRLSPDSLSIMEFKCDLDVTISEKTLRFPLLGETLPSVPIMDETTASLVITVEGMEVVERWRKQGCWEQMGRCPAERKEGVARLEFRRTPPPPRGVGALPPATESRSPTRACRRRLCDDTSPLSTSFALSVRPIARPSPASSAPCCAARACTRRT